MKKRGVALILLVALILSVLPGIHAATPLCFVAMNDSVPLTLTDGSAPYYSGGKLYLPYTAFNASPNGVGASYNAKESTFVLFNSDEMLIFDLSGGTYTDIRKKEYSVSLAYRGSMLYVPATVLSHFGLSATMLTSRAGYSIIRFTNGEQVYDDGMFVAQAENLITHVAQQYAQTGNGQLTGQGVGGNGTGAGAEGTGNPVQVYLAFAGEAVSAETLRKLKQYGARASFFLTKDQLVDQRDLVREIYAGGHTVGLTAEPGAELSARYLDECNQLLDEILFCRTPMALASASSGMQTELYCVFHEPAYARDIASVLAETDRSFLYVVRENASSVVDSFSRGGASLLQLVETSGV